MTTTLPDNYDPRGLAPRILIYDQNLQLQYIYEHPQLIDTPQQDYSLLSWDITGGINSYAGTCSVTIEDHDTKLTTDVGISVIRPGWHIQILLGKSADSLESWFFGIVNEPAVQRDGYDQQTIMISSYGYSNTLSTRYVTIEHEQERDEETGKLDNTDMSACVSELVKQLFHEDNLLLPPADPNLNIDQIEAIDVKLASLSKQNQSQGIVISELANVVNAVYGVDPNLNFYFHASNKHSGFVITNDNATNIDVNRLMIMRNKPYQTKDSTIRKAFTSLIGVDLTLSLDIVKDTGGTSELSMTSGSWDEYGFRIPHNDKIKELQILLKRTATLNSDLTYDVRSSTSSTRHGNTDGESERTGTISAEDLNEQLTLNSNDWLSINLNIEQTTSTNDRIIWLNDGFDNLTILYNASAAGEIFRTLSSSSNVNNRRRVEGVGKPRFRIFGEPEQTLLKAQNLAVQNIQPHKEQMQYLRGTPPSETVTSIFEGLMDQAGQIRRVINPTVSVPNTRPPLGQQIRIIDTHNGLDTDMLLIGYDITSTQQLTSTDMTIELERYL